MQFVSVTIRCSQRYHSHRHLPACVLTETGGAAFRWNAVPFCCVGTGDAADTNKQTDKELTE